MQALGVTPATMQCEDFISETSVSALLAATFAGALVAYEAYSEFETPTRQFHSEKELLDHITESRASGRQYFDVVIHYEATGGSAVTSRYELNPERCNGARWREKTEGWGLVSVQLTYGSGGPVKARISANSEKRAKAWEQTLVSRLGPVQAWHWPVVEKHCRRLIRRLRSDA